MQMRIQWCATREDERFEIRQRLVEFVYPALQPFNVSDLRLKHSLPATSVRRGKLGTEVEELVLYESEFVSNAGLRFPCGKSHANTYEAIELIDIAVGLYSRGVFTRASSTYQTRRAIVASACVNSVESYHTSILDTQTRYLFVTSGPEGRRDRSAGDPGELLPPPPRRDLELPDL